MITTRIIAALMAPSAGLLTIVGALPLLYTNPSRTQTYPPPLGQTTFLGPFSTWRKHKKSRVKILSNRKEGWGPEVGPKQNPCCGWWWFGANLFASPLLWVALRDQAKQVGRVKSLHPSLEPSFSHSANHPTFSRSFFGQHRESRWRSSWSVLHDQLRFSCRKDHDPKIFFKGSKMWCSDISNVAWYTCIQEWRHGAGAARMDFWKLFLAMNRCRLI